MTEKRNCPGGSTGAASDGAIFQANSTGEFGPLRICKPLPVSMLFGQQERAAVFLAFSEEAFGGRYAFTRKGQQWWRWDGCRWLPTSVGAMRPLVRRTLFALHDRIRDDGRLPGYDLSLLLDVNRALALVDHVRIATSVTPDRLGVAS